MIILGFFSKSQNEKFHFSSGFGSSPAVFVSTSFFGSGFVSGASSIVASLALEVATLAASAFSLIPISKFKVFMNMTRESFHLVFSSLGLLTDLAVVFEVEGSSDSLLFLFGASGLTLLGDSLILATFSSVLEAPESSDFCSSFAVAEVGAVGGGSTEDNTNSTLDFKVFNAWSSFWFKSWLRVELTRIRALRSPFSCFKTPVNDKLN